MLFFFFFFILGNALNYQKLLASSQLTVPGHASAPVTLEKEVRRRKTENTATELWYYLQNKMKQLDQSGAGDIMNLMDLMRTQLEGYHT